MRLLSFYRENVLLEARLQGLSLELIAAGLLIEKLLVKIRSEERRVGEACRYQCDWSSDVCSSDLLSFYRENVLLEARLQGLSLELIAAGLLIETLLVKILNVELQVRETPGDMVIVARGHRTEE